MTNETIIAFDISKYDNNVFLYYNTLYDERDEPIEELGNYTLNQFNKLTVSQKKSFFGKKRQISFKSEINNNSSKTVKIQSETLSKKLHSIINKPSLRDNNNSSNTSRTQSTTLSKKLGRQSSLQDKTIVNNNNHLKTIRRISTTYLARLRSKKEKPKYVKSSRQSRPLDTVLESETFDDLDNTHGWLGLFSLKDKEKLKKEAKKDKEKLKKKADKEKLKKQTEKDKEKLKKQTEKDKEKLKKQTDKEKLKKQTEKAKEKLKKQTDKEKLKKQKDKEKLKKQKDKSRSLFNFNNVIKRKRLSKKIKGGEISNDYIKQILNCFKIRDTQHDFKTKITKKDNHLLYSNFITPDDNTAFIKTIVDLSANGHISFDRLYFIFTLNTDIYIDNYLVLKKSVDGTGIDNFLQNNLLTKVSKKYIYDGKVNINDVAISNYISNYLNDGTTNSNRVISPEILFDTMAIGLDIVKEYMQNINLQSSLITDKVYNSLTGEGSAIKDEYTSAFDLDTSQLFNIVYFKKDNDIGIALLFLKNQYNSLLLTKIGIEEIKLGNKRAQIKDDTRLSKKLKRGGDYIYNIDYIKLKKVGEEYISVDDYDVLCNRQIFVAIYIPIKDNPFAKNNIELMIEITKHYFDSNPPTLLASNKYDLEIFKASVKKYNKKLVSISILVLQYLIIDYHTKITDGKIIDIHYILNIIYNLKSSGDYGKVLYGYYHNIHIKNEDDDEKVALITNDTLCGLHSILRENTDVITGAHRMETYYDNPVGDVRFLVIYKSQNSVKNNAYLVDKLNSTLNTNLSIPIDTQNNNIILDFSPGVKNYLILQITSHFNNMVTDTIEKDNFFPPQMNFGIISETQLALDAWVFFCENCTISTADHMIQMEKTFNKHIHKLKFLITDYNTYCTRISLEHESVKTLYEHRLNNLYIDNKGNARSTTRQVKRSTVYVNITLDRIALKEATSSEDRKNTFLYHSIILYLIKGTFNRDITYNDVNSFLIFAKFINSALTSFKRFYELILNFKEIKTNYFVILYKDGVITLSDNLFKRQTRFIEVLNSMKSEEFKKHIASIIDKKSGYHYIDVCIEVNKIYKNFMNDIDHIVLIGKTLKQYDNTTLTPINYIVKF